MPKIRTHRGTKKRFHVTSTGKVMRRKSFRSHLLQKKSSKRKRTYANLHEVVGTQLKNIRRRAPYM